MAVPGQDVRDWEFAEKFSLPIVRTVQPAEGHPDDEAFPVTASRSTRPTTTSRWTGSHVDEAKARDHRPPGARRAGRGDGQLPHPRLAVQPPALLGRAVPDHVRRGRRGYPVPEDQLPLTLPDVPDYSPKTFEPDDATSSPSRRCRACPSGSTWSWTWATGGACGASAARPTRCPTGPGRAGTTSATSTRRTTRRSSTRPTRRTGSPPSRAGRGRARRHPRPGRRRPLRRGRRARGPAPALCPLLAQGPLRPRPRRERGAVPQVLLAGLHPGLRLHRQPRAVRPGGRGGGAPGRAGGGADVRWQGEPVSREYGKIGKSLKNSVSPDEMYDAYGADTFRVYEMSMGPLELSKPWEIRAVVGPSASCNGCGATCRRSDR